MHYNTARFETAKHKTSTQLTTVTPNQHIWNREFRTKRDQTCSGWVETCRWGAREPCTWRWGIPGAATNKTPQNDKLVRETRLEMERTRRDCTREACKRKASERRRRSEKTRSAAGAAICSAAAPPKSPPFFRFEFVGFPILLTLGLDVQMGRYEKVKQEAHEAHLQYVV